MRKHFILSLALLLAFAMAVSAADMSTKTKYHRMHGEISSLDATAQTFTVKHGKETSTFKTDASTKFKGARQGHDLRGSPGR